MFIVLIAPSGKCRKSTATNIGVKLLTEAKVSILREKITPRALTQYLADQIIIKDKVAYGDSKAYIYAPEFSVFLGRDAAQSGLLNLLTSLYDSPDIWEYRTATQGRDFLYNVCVNMLGASAPDWLVHGIPADAIGGGLTARMMFVAQTESPRKNASPKVSQKMRDLRAKLVEMLSKMCEIKGGVEISPTAGRFFEEWYENKDQPEDERFASFWEREHDHLLKVAMVLATSRKDLFKSNVISEEHINSAIIVLDQLKNSMHLAYQGIGEHVAARGYERILNLIERFGGKVEHSLLLRRLWYYFDSEMFKKCMDLLIDTNRVKMEISKTGKRYYSTIRERRRE
jgi:hypothetical protein